MASVPKRYDGSPEEEARNRASHNHDGLDGRCLYCDRRPGSVSAGWPCGASVPREPYGGSA